jgi:T5SS/PEP-CTERM-associated repeat protein
MNLTDGTLTIANDLNIGSQHTNNGTVPPTVTPGTGFFTMDGATSTVTNSGFSIGRDGTGTLTINDGSLTCNNDNAWVGYSTGSTGTFNINGGTTNVTGGGRDLTIGRNGTGNLIMTDGTLTIADDLIFGSTAAGDGTMTMSGGVVQLNDLKIGNNGKGELTMNGPVGGSIVGSGLLMVGEVAGSDGKLHMESGSITAGGIAYVGFNGTGLLDMTGGSITIPADKPLVIGRNNDSSGEVLLKGGTITAGALEFTNGTQVAVLSHMDITDGTLVLSGNRVDQVNGFIDAGYLTTAYGGGCLLNVVYDSGTDLTTVTAGAASDAFEVWASGFGSVGRFDADDDGDGVSNGEEWCFYGTDPTVSQSHGSPIPDVAQTDPGTFTFTHLRPTPLDGFTQSYEWSATLQDPWYAADASDGAHTVSFAVGTPEPDIEGYEKVTVTATASPATIPGFFARLKVTTD